MECLFWFLIGCLITFVIGLFFFVGVFVLLVLDCVCFPVHVIVLVGFVHYFFLLLLLPVFLDCY